MSIVFKKKQLQKDIGCSCNKKKCDEIEWCVSFQQKGARTDGLLRIELKSKKMSKKETIERSVTGWKQENVTLKGKCSSTKVDLDKRKFKNSGCVYLFGLKHKTNNLFSNVNSIAYNPYIN